MQHQFTYLLSSSCLIQIAQTQNMLANEYGTASNIKSRVNRQSVLAAITSAQQRLKLYNKIPPNGLIVYTGTVLTDDGKEKKMNIDFEPFKPINTSLYLCDNKFHTEALAELMETDSKYGFIVMDGNGTLFGTLSGNTREVLHKFTVDLPKKHGRGGQSALRFARLRMEKRHNYVRKVAELAVQQFITADRPNVAGLVLAGSADFKTELSQSDMFDQRLQAVILAVVDVSYGTFKKKETSCMFFTGINVAWYWYGTLLLFCSGVLSTIVIAFVREPYQFPARRIKAALLPILHRWLEIKWRPPNTHLDPLAPIL
jgi:peptide chain release factor 1